MRYEFARLRFVDDVNLKDKTYWYWSDMNLETGDKVLAPVGIHDRLQAAVVEETLSREPKEAPYEWRSVKSVMARCGVRTLTIDSIPLLEFGGQKYDAKHYTPFGRVLYCKENPAFSPGLRFYGIKLILFEEETKPFEVLESAHGGAILCRERGREIFEALTNLVKGKEDPLFRSEDPEMLMRLKEKLL